MVKVSSENIRDLNAPPPIKTLAQWRAEKAALQKAEAIRKAEAAERAEAYSADFRQDAMSQGKSINVHVSAYEIIMDKLVGVGQMKITVYPDRLEVDGNIVSEDELLEAVNDFISSA